MVTLRSLSKNPGSQAVFSYAAAVRRTLRVLLTIAAAVVGLVAGAAPARAQTPQGGPQLSACDIAIIGRVNNGTPDTFAFTTLAPIPAGANIFFTDNGWNSTTSSFRTGEGTVRFIVNNALARGRTIRSNESSPDFAWSSAGGTLDFSTSGDQLYAFQAWNASSPLTSVTRHLYVLDDTNAFENATNANTGAVPPGLSIANGSAVTVSALGSNTLRSTAELASGAKGDWLSAIANTGNWTTGGALPSTNRVVDPYTTITDVHPNGASANGVLHPDEYGPNNAMVFSGDGDGTGGTLGRGSIYFNSSPDTLYLGFQPGNTANDVVVLYFDIVDGGENDATMSDDSGTDRNVVSNLGLAGDDGFPFQADYALAIWNDPTLFGSPDAYLYELRPGGAGSLVAVPGITANPLEVGAQRIFREYAIPFSALGATGGRQIRFFAAYCADTLFNSNETIPPMAAINSAPNPGQTLTVTYDAFCVFNTFCGQVGFTIQPESVQAAVADTVSFLAVGIGEPQDPLTYQWRKNGVNLVDAGSINGSTTIELTITAATPSDAGAYDCVVTGSCDTAVSWTAVLTLGCVTPVEVAHLIEPTGQPFSQIGWSSAISGDTAVVGSFNTAGPPSSTYVYARSDGVWSHQATFPLVGNSVGISGTTIVIGVSGDGAYVFTRSGATWTQEQKLVPSDGAGGAFGYSVAIDGDTVVVGVPESTLTGAAYVFTRIGTTWSQQQRLVAADGATGDAFGQAVAVSGDTIAVGANFDDTEGGTDAGSAYVFVRSADVWSEQQKLTAPDGAAGDDFGWALDVEGDTIVVAADEDWLEPWGNVGSVHIFTRSGTTWSPLQQVWPYEISGGSFFGIDVDLCGDMLAVGAFGEDQAYLLRRTGTTWAPLDRVTGADAAGTQFGWSVGISGTSLVVGAIRDDTPAGQDAGSAYFFDITSNPPVITNDPDALTSCSGTSASFSVEAAGLSLTYQWRKDGSNLVDGGAVSGATGATLVIDPVAPGDTGSYDCVVTRVCDSVTSTAAALTITPPPEITEQPQGLTRCPGQSASFSVAASGSSITYQWRKNGSNLDDGGRISGATSPTLIIHALLESDHGVYDCVVTGACETVASGGATLTVHAGPRITADIQGGFVCPGTPFTFTVVAEGDSLSYQWFRDGVQVGANSPSLFIPAVSAADEGVYWVNVSGPCNVAFGQPASLRPSDLAAPAPDVPSLPTLTGECTVAVSTPYPTATDACAGTITGVPSQTSFSGEGTYTLTWTYDDGNGNTSTQTQAVVIDDTVAPVLTPGTINVCYASVAAAEAAAMSATGTGDNCAGAVTLAAATDGTCAATITVTGNDGHGNVASVMYSTTIDGDGPVLTCPANVTVSVPAAPAMVTLDLAEATDDCPGTPGIVNSFTPDGPDAGGLYPAGTTTVTFTATDPCGNTSVCSMSVTVEVVTSVAAAYVDDDYVGLPSGTPVNFPHDGAPGPYTIGVDAFAAVQEGLDGVEGGGTLSVAAGAYAENLVIKKSVTLTGPNAGTCTNSGATRVDEAIIAPAAADAALDRPLVYVTASSVTIDGFTLDADNPDLTGGVGVGDADADTEVLVANGSSQDPATYPFVPVRGVHVVNSILRSANTFGVHLANPSEAPLPDVSDENVIACNWITNFPRRDGFAFTPFRDERTAVRIGRDTYAKVDDNEFTRVAVGIRTGPNARPNADGAAPPSISRNTIAAGRLGIWHEQHARDASGWTLDGNTVAFVPDDFPAAGFPIAVMSVTSDAPTTLSGNLMAGGSAGLYLWNNSPPTVPAASPIAISGGSVTGAAKGVWAANYERFFQTTPGVDVGAAGVPAHYRLSGVSVCDCTEFGVYVEDDWQAGGVQPVRVDAHSVTSSAAFIGIYAHGPLASIDCQSSTFINQNVGIAGIYGCRVRVESCDLRGNAYAAISVVSDPILDAGNCAGVDLTGMGASTGANILSGYGFDNTFPFAIETAVPSAAYAQNNDFGAGPGDDIEDVVVDDTNIPGAAPVIFSQAGDLLVVCPGPISLQCAADIPAPATDETGFETLGGVVSATAYTVSSIDTGSLVSGEGTITRIYTITSCSATSTCTQTITIDDVAAPLIATSPPARAAFADGGCSAPVPDFTSDVIASDNCTSFVVTQAPPPGTPVGLGVTAVTLTVDDGRGNTALCAVDFTVADNTPPAISSCAPSATVSADAECQARIPDLTGEVAASDGCTSSLVILQSPLPGASVGVGAHAVVITALDEAGLSATCTATVTVVDDTPPTISVCATDRTIAADAGCFATLPDLTGEVLASDACSAPISISQNPAPGTSLALGMTTVTFTATDSAGNSTACTAEVTVSGGSSGTVTYVDDDYADLPTGTSVTWPHVGGTGSHTIGCDAFATVQQGVDAVSAEGQVLVAEGDYHEDVAVIKPRLQIVGVGDRRRPRIHGVPGGASATIRLAAPDIHVSGLFITREGNNLAQWNDPALNTAGVAVIGHANSGSRVSCCTIAGNRTGVDINNAGFITIESCDITFNRTGLIFRNITDNCAITNNAITDNWTVGVLFLDAAPGPQSAHGTAIFDNAIAGNWYADIQDRMTTAAPKNFSRNWFSPTVITVSAANTNEPGYAALIPVAYGGSASNPGGAPNIAGVGASNIDFSPFLVIPTDASPDCGFQPDLAAVGITARLAQTGLTGRVQEAHDAVPPGGVILAEDGDYPDNLVVTKADISLIGPNAGACASSVAARNPEAVLMPALADSTLDTPLVYVTASGFTIDGLTLDADNPALASGVPAGAAGADSDTDTLVANGSSDDPAAYPFIHVRDVSIINCVLRSANDVAVNLVNDGAFPVSDDNSISCNWFDNLSGQNTLSAGGPYDRVAVLLLNDTYAAVDDNEFSEVRVGVQTGNNSRANTGAPAGIRRNAIISEVAGIRHNNHSQGASAWSIAGNTLSDSPVSAADNYAISITSILGDVEVTVADNTVTDGFVGLYLWNNVTAAPVTITGGSIGARLGVLATDADGGYGAASGPTHIIARGIEIRTPADGVGVSIGNFVGQPVRMDVAGVTQTADQPLGFGIRLEGAGASVRVDGSSFTNNAHGVYILDGRAAIESTNLAGNAVTGLSAAGASAVVDAGNCLAADLTGLGASAGGNTLTGYGFDNAAPFAIDGQGLQSSGAVYAENNAFGASVGDDIESLLLDDTNGFVAPIIFSQSGGILLACPPALSVGCAGDIPPGLSTIAAFGAAGGRVSASNAAVDFADAGTLINGEGVVTRTYTVTTACGDSASCVQTITVDDTAAPVISACAPDQHAFADAGCVAAVPDFASTIAASDNCGTFTASQSPAPGSLAPIGITQVTITVDDGHGNLAACHASFTVIDNTPPVLSSCAPDASAPADNNCQAVVPDLTGLAVFTDACDSSLTLTQSPTAGTPVGLGATVVTITADDDAGNAASCLVNLTVADTTPPSFVACAPAQSAAADAACQALVPDFTAFAAATDNCSAAVTLAQSPLAGTPAALGTTTVTLTATDGAGLTATCATTFTVADQTHPSISQCAPPLTLVATGTDCTAALPDLALAVVATDNCTPLLTVTQSPAAGTPLPSGSTAVTFTVTDDANNATTCETIVTVTVPAIAYVNHAATGANNGSSWTDAYTDLQDALDAAACAQTGGGRSQIWVAQGAYRPDRGSGDRTATFQLQSNVGVFGGFNATETLLAQRDPALNVTLLSGEIADATLADNSYSVVTGSSTDPSAILDGFVIAHGRSAPLGTGAGILIEKGSPTIVNCLFVSNAAFRGGAVYAEDSAPVFLRCTFLSNAASDGGGAIRAVTSAMDCVNCRFLGNTASLGAAVYNTGASDTNFTNCTFSGNAAASTGGALYNTLSSLATITNCTLASNSAAAVGGIYTSGSISQIVLSSSILYFNSDGSGPTEQAQLFAASRSMITASFCDIQGLANTPGSGNISADPLLADLDGPDDAVGTLDDDLRLSAGSPAIDAGSNPALPVDVYDLDADLNTSEQLPLDLALAARRSDDAATPDSGLGAAPIVDMGAYEFECSSVDCNANGVCDAAELATGAAADCFTPAAPPVGGVNAAGGPDGVPDECQCVADWNRDGVVNSTDVSDFINTYFDDEVHGAIHADINCNGVSNSTDVSDFINIWFEVQAGLRPDAGCII